MLTLIPPLVDYKMVLTVVSTQQSMFSVFIMLRVQLGDSMYVVVQVSPLSAHRTHLLYFAKPIVTPVKHELSFLIFPSMIIPDSLCRKVTSKGVMSVGPSSTYLIISIVSSSSVVFMYSICSILEYCPIM